MTKKPKQKKPEEKKQSERVCFTMQMPRALHEKLKQHADSEMRSGAKQAIIILSTYYKV